MTDESQDTPITTGVSRADRSLHEATDEAFAAIDSKIERLQDENERLRAVLEAAEGSLGYFHRSVIHQGPCLACDRLRQLRAAVAAIRQAEAER